MSLEFLRFSPHLGNEPTLEAQEVKLTHQLQEAAGEKRIPHGVGPPELADHAPGDSRRRVFAALPVTIASN